MKILPQNSHYISSYKDIQLLHCHTIFSLDTILNYVHCKLCKIRRYHLRIQPGNDKPLVTFSVSFSRKTRPYSTT